MKNLPLICISTEVYSETLSVNPRIAVIELHIIFSSLAPIVDYSVFGPAYIDLIHTG